MKLVELKTYQEIEKLASIKNEHLKVQCKCGTKTLFSKADRTICRGCGHWVYRNKQIEFKYKLKESLKNERNCNSTI